MYPGYQADKTPHIQQQQNEQEEQDPVPILRPDSHSVSTKYSNFAGFKTEKEGSFTKKWGERNIRI